MALSYAKTLCLPMMNLVKTRAVPIIEQLHLEERLLRTSSDNWCIINDGTNASTIVMGASGKPSELIDLKSVLQNQIPVVKRFSGGGTVIVDEETIFITFICNKDAIPGLQPYPHPIMSWTGQLYGKALPGITGFSLRENDYVFGNHKFGGNAQSITRKRWIHHTSFLWDYDAANMKYLKQPSRAPKYRSDLISKKRIGEGHEHEGLYFKANKQEARNHVDFLCAMKDYITSRSDFIERTITAIQYHFSLRPVQVGELISSSEEKMDTFSTRSLTEVELEAAMVSSVTEQKLAVA